LRQGKFFFSKCDRFVHGEIVFLPVFDALRNNSSAVIPSDTPAFDVTVNTGRLFPKPAETRGKSTLSVRTILDHSIHFPSIRDGQSILIPFGRYVSSHKKWIETFRSGTDVCPSWVPAQHTTFLIVLDRAQMFHPGRQVSILGRGIYRKESSLPLIVPAPTGQFEINVSAQSGTLLPTQRYKWVLTLSILIVSQHLVTVLFQTLRCHLLY
jgi:hypothetical protein